MPSSADSAAPSTRRSFLRSALGLAAALGASNSLAAQAPRSRRPNVILLLVDDWGWTDLGAYGSSFYETPHLDKVAKEGIRFTNAYASCPVCSPTRAALLTGKVPRA